MSTNRGGRPTKPEGERMSAVIALRLTKAMHDKLMRLGGVEWIRARIQAAKEPKP